MAKPFDLPRGNLCNLAFQAAKKELVQSGFKDEKALAKAWTKKTDTVAYGAVMRFLVKGKLQLPKGQKMPKPTAAGFKQLTGIIVNAKTSQPATEKEIYARLKEKGIGSYINGIEIVNTLKT